MNKRKGLGCGGNEQKTNTLGDRGREMYNVTMESKKNSAYTSRFVQNYIFIAFIFLNTSSYCCKLHCNYQNHLAEDYKV